MTWQSNKCDSDERIFISEMKCHVISQSISNPIKQENRVGMIVIEIIKLLTFVCLT